MQKTSLESFRLSPLQRHLCTLQNAQQVFPFHTYCTVRIEGPLTIPRLQTALQHLVERYEILRTSFPRLPGLSQPVQVIHAPPPLALVISDLKHFSAQRQEEALVEIREALLSAPLSLEADQLLQAALIICTPQLHLLLLHMPALKADSVTCSLLLQEMARFYEEGADNELLEPLQFADLAAWQDELLESSETAAGRYYWQTVHPQGFTQVSLPYEQPVGYTEQCTSDRLQHTLSATLTQRIYQFAYEQQLTPDIVLLTCWSIVLSRLTEQERLLIGTGYHGRKYAELADAIGLFARYLPLICHVPGHLRFREVARQVQERWQEAQLWQEYFSWEQLADDEKQSNEPYYTFGFDYETLPTPFSNGPLLFTIEELESDVERCTVRLSCRQSSHGLAITLYYDGERYHKTHMQSLLAQWQAVLLQALEAPEIITQNLDILGDEERSQLLQEWNTTHVAYPQTCVHHLFEKQVERTPERIAAINEEAYLTYHCLNECANTVARYLQSQGVGPDVCVGLCLERSFELLIGLLGILKAGGTYVPLDHHAPQERLAFVLRDAKIALLLSQERLASNNAFAAIPLLCLDRDWEWLSQKVKRLPAIRGETVQPAHLAYIIYTSGSTGQPKGVMVPHKGLVNYLLWCTNAYDVVHGEGTLLHSPLTFDLTITDLFSALLSGKQVRLLSETAGVEALSQALYENTELSLVKLTPAHLDMLGHLLTPDAADHTHAFIIGGEALNSACLTFWRHYAPETRMVNEYGPTETTVGCCIYEVSPTTPDEGPVPIGRPIANTRLYVLDQRLRPIPIGLAGELYIGGDSLARGYFARPDLTAERFLPDPFSTTPGERLYKTGDRVRYLDDGTLVFLGRIDDQIKLRGYRIEPGEIETILTRHPDVREAFVLAREDTGGDQRIVAYICQDRMTDDFATILRTYLQNHLPDYMLPSAFVTLDALPLTANGKVDRQALLALPLDDTRHPTIHNLPRTPLEELLSSLWCEVLGCSQAGVDDNFFDLGGHSLLATRLISHIQARLQVDISLRNLFEKPTIAGIATLVQQALQKEYRVELPPLVPQPRTQPLRLSFAQQRLWFVDQLEPDNIAYLMPTARRLHGTLDVAALQQSLAEMIQRHESLRTTFQLVGEQPVQVIHQVAHFVLPFIDLRGLPIEEREHEAQRLARQEAHQPCNLQRGPLFRVALLGLASQEHVLLLTMHHIISDWWSNEVFYRELIVLHKAFTEGKPSPLPPLPLQYLDYALWQRNALQEESIEGLLAYWKHHMAGVTALALPTDYARPRRQTFHGAGLTSFLPAQLRETLVRLSQREGVTLFMFLLTAFQILLARYSGQDDICIGTAVANRSRPELEGLIGFFVNTLPLRTDLSGASTFLEALQRVREVALEAYTHQDVPFDHLVEVLQPERDLSRAPLFQVTFGVQQETEALEKIEGLTASGLGLEHLSTKFDLTFNIVSSPQGLRCAIEYNTDLFESTTIYRLLNYWQTLLESIAATPDAVLSDLLLRVESQQQIVPTEGDAAANDTYREGCLSTLFEEQAARTPDAIAAISEETCLSYAALNRYANQLAHYLQTRGISPESLVGVTVENTVLVLISLLGISKAGGVYLPLDPSYPQARLISMIEDAQPTILLTCKESQQTPAFPDIPTISLERYWPLLNLLPEQSPVSTVQIDNTAYVIYTSGSTGKPKGVAVTHRGLGNLATTQAHHFNIHGGSHVLLFASLSFDASIAEIVVTLLAGACLEIAPRQHLLPDLSLVRLLQERAITVVTLPPSVLSILPVEPLPLLETLVSAGERCPLEIVERWQPGRRFCNAYGPTEVTVCASVALCEKTPQETAHTHNRQRQPPIGHPLANTQLYILNERFQPVPPGVAGELCVSGVGLARGYLRLPGLTAERFIPHPFSGHSGERLYRTGDRVRYRPDGLLEYLGRLDQQVKIRGYRVELGEIEAVIRQHQKVHECIVLIDEKVADDQRLIAYLVLSDLTDTREIQHYVQEQLPNYMQPSLFISVAALPLTPRGKIDRQALQALKIEVEEAEEETIEPRTPIEKQLATIWRELLGQQKIGIYDDFFSLGGHSLLATRMLSRVQASMHVEVSIPTFFDATSIAELANIIEQEQNILIDQAAQTDLERLLNELEIQPAE